MEGRVRGDGQHIIPTVQVVALPETPQGNERAAKDRGERAREETRKTKAKSEREKGENN